MLHPRVTGQPFATLALSTGGPGRWDNHQSIASISPLLLPSLTTAPSASSPVVTAEVPRCMKDARRAWTRPGSPTWTSAPSAPRSKDSISNPARCSVRPIATAPDCGPAGDHRRPGEDPRLGCHRPGDPYIGSLVWRSYRAPAPVHGRTIQPYTRREPCNG
jgi:hypothetical protein